jgi:tRNA 2-thiouridine synthesizing protein A
MLRFKALPETTLMHADRELDVRGLNCPLPILRAKKMLGDLSAGQVLKVVATDPGSVKDFEAFCKQTGNELLSRSEGPEFTFFMKKR